MQSNNFPQQWKFALNKHTRYISVIGSDGFGRGLRPACPVIYYEIFRSAVSCPAVCCSVLSQTFEQLSLEILNTLSRRKIYFCLSH